MKTTKHIISLLLIAVAIAGCSHEEHAKNPVRHPLYGTVYEGSGGHYYARSCDGGSGDMWFWMWVMNSNSASASNSSSIRQSGATGLSPSYFQSGSWQRCQSPPAASSLKKTDVAVEEKEDGEPTEEAVEGAGVPADETIDASTSESQAKQEEQSSEQPEQESQSEGEDSGSESSASSSQGSQTSQSSDDTGGSSSSSSDGSSSSGGDTGGGGGGDD